MGDRGESRNNNILSLKNLRARLGELAPSDP